MDTDDSGSDSFGVKAWLNQHFIIDESQNLGIMTPKPVIRMLARQAPQLRHLLAEESGERMFDTIFKKAVVNSLTDEPRLKIDTEAGYHIDQHRSRTTKYRKVRSVRHVFPKHIHSVESELRDTYDRILTRSERAVRNMVAKDNAAMPPLPTRVAEQILTTQTLGNRDAQSRKRRIEVELDTVEGIEILSSNNGQKPQEGRQTPERFNSGDSDGTDDVEEVESVDETHTYDWGPAGPSRARVDSDAPVRRDQEHRTWDSLLQLYADSDGDIIVIELYAGTGSMIRQMMKTVYAGRLKYLIVDIGQPQEHGVEDLIDNVRGFYKDFDLSNFEPNDLEAWCKGILHTTVDQIARMHASFCCETFAYINLCNKNPPRDKRGTAITKKAFDHNRWLHKLFEVFKYMQSKNAETLITLENPAQSSFVESPLVQVKLAEAEWVVIKGDHCAGADEDLDGIVTGPRLNRQGGLVSKKPTHFCCLNVEEDCTLKSCDTDGCRMKVPGTKHHVLIVSNQAGKTRPGQRLAGARKAVIPLGVHSRIFVSHQQFLARRAGSRHLNKCTNCGKSGDLLNCSRQGCFRAQHEQCSIEGQTGQPWWCDSCSLLHREHMN
jgi:hypothetical protein